MNYNAKGKDTKRERIDYVGHVNPSGEETVCVVDHAIPAIRIVTIKSMSICGRLMGESFVLTR